MDIQLTDGISFQIFESCEIKSAVIFITAYVEYALKAFKVNSIDYILKPVDKEELETALRKYHQLTGGGKNTRLTLDNIHQAIQMLTKKFKSGFVIKVGEHLRSIEVTDISFFVSIEKATFC